MMQSSFSIGSAFNDLDPSGPIQLERAGTTSQFSVEAYLNAMDQLHCNTDSEARTIRIIARSANPSPVDSIWQHLEAIRARYVRVLAIFTDSRAGRFETELRQYVAVFGSDAARKNIRIAKFRNAHGIIEQMQLGVRDVWAERTSFETSASLVPEASYEHADSRDIGAARVSFEMVWAISSEITGNDLQG